jgi:hypothetical protein
MLKRLAIVLATTAAFAIAGSVMYAHSQPVPTPQPVANPTQDIIAKQLGDLIIANTSCGQQVLTLSSQLREARDELTKLQGSKTTPPAKGK